MWLNFICSASAAARCSLLSPHLHMASDDTYIRTEAAAVVRVADARYIIADRDRSCK